MPIKIDRFIFNDMNNDVDLWNEESDGLSEKKDWRIYIYHVAAGKEITFKAFLNSFKDTYKQNWKSENVYGRMDPIQRFQNTTRNVSFSFVVASYNEQDAFLNFEKVSKLIQMQYPVYSDNHGNSFGYATTISSPPMVKIKLGNLIIDAKNGDPAAPASESGLLATLEGVDMAPDLESGFFDPEPGILIPKQMEISLNATILHTHKLGFTPTPVGWKDGKTSWKKANKARANVGYFPYNLDDGLNNNPAQTEKTVKDPVESKINDMSDEDKKSAQSDADKINEKKIYTIRAVPLSTVKYAPRAVPLDDLE